MMTDGAAKLKLAASCRQLPHAKNIAIEHDLERAFACNRQSCCGTNQDTGLWLV
jgi:hypothetical protein